MWRGSRRIAERSSFPSGYCSAVRGVAGSLLVMVSTVPVTIPLMVRRSASTATTLYFSLKNPVSLHPIGILMRNLGTVFPPVFRERNCPTASFAQANTATSTAFSGHARTRIVQEFVSFLILVEDVLVKA